MYFFKLQRDFFLPTTNPKSMQKKKIYETSNQNVSPIKEKLKQTGSFY